MRAAAWHGAIRETRGAGFEEMEYEVRDGRLFFWTPDGRVRLQGLRPAVFYEVGGEPRRYRPYLERSEGGAHSAANEDGLALRVSVTREGLFVVVRLVLEHRGSRPLRVCTASPLWLPDFGEVFVGPSARHWSVYRNGYQSWTGTRSFRAHETDADPWSFLLRVGLIDIARPSPASPGHFRSDSFTAIANLRSREVLVAGFLDVRRAFADIEVAIVGDRCGRWEATVRYEGKSLCPGEKLEVAPLALAAGDDGYALLAAYAERSGFAMEARVPERSPIGWCSWYEYFTDIDVGAIRENIDAAKRLRPLVAFDYVQIDDGYQAAVGDWLEPDRKKFPRGVAPLAAEIREAGFVPGIWLAPFIARSNARLVAEHPEWFVRDNDGRLQFALWNPLWGLGPCYALDTTHPEVQEWIREVVETVVHRWGFSLLKLDFLYAAALPGVRYDREATRAHALRRGLETIRAAAGDQAFLIGCGCPLGPAVGIVDAMRIGPDVAPFWSNFLSRTVLRDLHGVATKHAIRNTLTRAFLHRRWWLNDPDCLMVRSHRTKLTEEEFRALATAVVATDGLLVVSDRLSLLTPSELERLQQVLDIRRDVRFEPYVADLMEADPPGIVIARSSEQCAVAVWNFADEPSSAVIPVQQWLPNAAGLAHVFEHWTGQVADLRAGALEIEQFPPHGARLFMFPAEGSM